MNAYIKTCGNCKHLNKDMREQPCRSGIAQIAWGETHCDWWEPNLWTRIRRFWDKFRDDQELIRLKLAVVLVLMIVGMTLDSWRL